MIEIAAAIQEGASAYLNRQYIVIAIIGAVIAVILGVALGLQTAILYVVGAACSAAAGYVGMNVSVRTNLRTAEAARGGLNRAMSIAFRGGAVTGFMVVGLGLLGVSVSYFFTHNLDALVGLGFGASLVSVFAGLVGFFLATNAFVSAGWLKAAAGVPDPRNLFWAGVVGIVITILIVAITEYFTETRYRPVHLIARQSVTGHATNIIAGSSIGMMATALPVLTIRLGILV